MRIARAARALARLPAAPAAAQEDFPLSEPGHDLWRWATGEHATTARAAPARAAPAVARVRTRTPEGTPEALPLLARRAVGGELWVRVRLPVLPIVEIHGMNQPGILPGRVSHGCIRMRDRDILRLDRRTPVTIR